MSIKQLLLAAAGASLMLLAGGWLGLMLYAHLVIGLPLTEQAALLRLPANFGASTRVNRPMNIKLEGPVTAEVPLQQTLAIPLQGSYRTTAAFDTTLPLHLTLHYHGQVPVKTYVDIQGNTNLVTGQHWFLPHFALKARIPVSLMLPVDLTVPVDTPLRFSYRGPLQISLNQTISAPINTVLHTHLRLDNSVSAPVQASFALQLQGSPAAVPVVIQKADLLVSPASFSFRLADGLR